MQSFGVYGWNLEQNTRIVKGVSLPPFFIWNRAIFLASLWCSAHGCFKGVTISAQRDWAALLTLSLVFFFLYLFVFSLWFWTISYPPPAASGTSMLQHPCQQAIPLPKWKKIHISSWLWLKELIWEAMFFASVIIDVCIICASYAMTFGSTHTSSFYKIKSYDMICPGSMCELSKSGSTFE